jgi:hypothetical protein
MGRTQQMRLTWLAARSHRAPAALLLSLLLSAPIVQSAAAFDITSCPGPGQTIESVSALENSTPVRTPITAGPVEASSQLSFSTGDLRKSATANELAATGIYVLEASMDFNVLDAAFFDPVSEQTVLIGHSDSRYKGSKIPYLQHLSTLLEHSRPEITLKWSPGSERKVDAFLARMDDPNHLKSLVRELGTIWGSGKGTQRFEWLMAYLGIKPDIYKAPNFDRVALNASMLIKGGDRRAACVLIAMRDYDNAASNNADNETKHYLFRALYAALGIEADQVAAWNRWKSGEISEAQYRRNGYRELCASFDRIFRFEGAPVSRALQIATQRGDRDPTGACFVDFNRHLREISERALDGALGKAREIVVPVEGIASLVGERPEVVPVFSNVDPRSQLARVLFEADYLGKKLINLPEFEQTGLPGYKTEFIFNRENPSKRVGKNATQHLWFSIGGRDAVESSDGRMLELKSVTMRINIREYDARGRDKPRIVGGYGDFLSAQYPQFAETFPALHELEEAGKVSVIADWILRKKPGFRLPKEGRQMWTPPTSIPGVIYLNLSLIESQTAANTVLSAVGGASLALPDVLPPLRQGSGDLGTALADSAATLSRLFDGSAGPDASLPNWKFTKTTPNGWSGSGMIGNRPAVAVAVKAGANASASPALASPSLPTTPSLQVPAVKQNAEPPASQIITAEERANLKDAVAASSGAPRAASACADEPLAVVPSKLEQCSDPQRKRLDVTWRSLRSRLTQCSLWSSTEKETLKKDVGVFNLDVRKCQGDESAYWAKNMAGAQCKRLLIDRVQSHLTGASGDIVTKLQHTQVFFGDCMKGKDDNCNMSLWYDNCRARFYRNLPDGNEKALNNLKDCYATNIKIVLEPKNLCLE